MASFKALSSVLTVAALAAAPAFVSAQTAPGAGTASGVNTGFNAAGQGRSYLPGTTDGYMGLNIGRSDFDAACAGGSTCDRRDVGGKIYLGGKVHPNVGMEAAYVHTGKAEIDGGTRRGQGLNLSLVGSLPMNSGVDVFGKVGTTYGWTKTSVGSGVSGASGSEHGLSLSYGAGVSFDVTSNIAAVLEWDRQRFKFAGGRDDVDLYTVGVKYKF